MDGLAVAATAAGRLAEVAGAHAPWFHYLGLAAGCACWVAAAYLAGIQVGYRRGVGVGYDRGVAAADEAAADAWREVAGGYKAGWDARDAEFRTSVGQFARLFDGPAKTKHRAG